MTPTQVPDHPAMTADAPIHAGEPPHEQPPVPRSVPLPELVTPLEPAEIVRKLDALARKGKLPGYEHGARHASRGTLFSVEAFGHPFDGVCTARGERAGGRTTLRFTTAMRPKLPVVFVLVTIATIWPGVDLTESMLASLFPGTQWVWKYTAYWYLPLSILPAPFMLRAWFTRSLNEIHHSAHEQVRAIASSLGLPRG